MESFATVEELEARWRMFTDAERERVEAELLDTTAFIRSQLRRYRVPILPEDEVQEYNLRWVTCAVAKRSLQAEFDSGEGGMGGPVSKYSETADVFSASVTFANPLGDRYLTKQEKQALGIGRVLVGSVRAADFDMEKRREQDYPPESA